jgi:hypothetical protein
MAVSKCVACGGTFFELQETRVNRSAFRLNFIQCSSCGGVIGVQEFHNIGALIEDQNKVIAAIAKQVGVSPNEF